MGKLVVNIMIGILCINMSIYLVNSYGFFEGAQTLTSLTPEEVSDNIDIDSLITPDSSLVTPFYNFWKGMNSLWTLVSTLVLGLPNLLTEFGVPDPVMYVVKAIYGLLLSIFFIEFFSGKEITD